MAKPMIPITWESANACKFSFQTENGKITGMVSVARQSRAPDLRTKREKKEVAIGKIEALVKELSEALSDVADA